MAERHFILNASTHVDLAWKWGRAEMSEMLEVATIRVLDALKADPDFKYTIEQSAHYRALAARRPDLIEQLRPYLHNGRIEMAGCMASTLDTNLPAGESFVRNQLLGMKWAEQTWGYRPKSGWLIDTFGINAQVPQILRQFGLKYLSANRLGGDKYHAVMWARGLDRTQSLVVGSDVYSPFVRPERIAIACYSSWKQIDALFEEADRLRGQGPFMVFAQTENELLISHRPFEHVRRLQQERPHERWTTGTALDYFVALEQSGASWPVVDGDMNPEFTGCFSLRPKIRLRNRRAETLLLEAEKWACLAGSRGGQATLENAWWEMAFTQFHDVFTGSHPTSVYDEVIKTFDAIDAAAGEVSWAARRSFVNAAADTETVAFNGLPWRRQHIVRLPLRPDAGPVRRVTAAGVTVPFDVRHNEIHALISIPAGGLTPVSIEHNDGTAELPQPAPKLQSATLENEFIKLEFDTVVGLRRLTWLPTGAVLMHDAGDLLVVQQDDGNFQIESPTGCEVVAAAGTLSLTRAPTAHGSDQVTLRGEFPPLAWAGPGAKLTWEIAFSLTPNRASVDLCVKLQWKGEASRVRLKLSTAIDAAGGVYEVPFGTVHRKPYGSRGTARGEWPAQRFVAVEDSQHGIALANTGAAGVEVGGGRIITSLLRAPSGRYSGMIPDESSSSHGHHRFEFALVPYAGKWMDSPIVQVAQELNNPLHLTAGATASERSMFAIDTSQIVLSAIKMPEDGTSDEVIVRVFEISGSPAEGSLRLAGAVKAWLSDLPEARGAEQAVAEETIQLRLKPFEIQTLRIQLRR